jgi:hypothetical protein
MVHGYFDIDASVVWATLTEEIPALLVGGSKTYSMLALYHLFSDIAPTELAGIDAIMPAAGARAARSARWSPR